MSFTFDAENFRILRKVSINDPGKVSVFVGPNESGKTTIAQGIKFAFIGEAYGRKGKESHGLVSHGQSRLNIRAQVGSQYASRTTSGGDAIRDVANRFGVPPDVLPLLFDARMCGDGGNKGMQAFLNGAGSSRFDARAHFADDPSIRVYIDKALSAGKIATKSQIEYCESQRALQKAPPEPNKPATLRYAEADLNAFRSAQANARDVLTTETATKNSVDALARGLASIACYLAAHDEWQAKKDAAGAGDALAPSVRSSLESMGNINQGTLAAIEQIVAAAGFDPAPVTAARAHIVDCQGKAHTTLAANPRPVPLPPEPQLPSGLDALISELKAQDGFTRQGVAAFLSATLPQQADMAQRVTAASQALAQAESTLSSALRADGAWEAYIKSLPDWQANVAKANEEWARWDRAAKAIAAAEKEFLAKVGNEFAVLVDTYAARLLNGRSVKIDLAEGITLAGEPMDDLSASTRWRVEVAVMAAIAKVSRSPLLIIDGADILRGPNRDNFSALLVDTLATEFEHVIVLAACDAVEDEKQYTGELAGRITKWLVQNGEVTKL